MIVGHFCQHFTIYLNILGFDFAHEFGIAQALLRQSRIDTCDPKATEITFAITTVIVCMIQGIDDGLTGRAEQL